MTIATSDDPTPEEQLAALERAAEDGEEVTPEQLAVARERVTLSGLIARGMEKRAEAQRRRDFEARQAAAKAQVRELLADLDPEFSAEVAKLRNASAELATAIQSHNAKIDEAAALYRAGGVVAASSWAQQVDLLDVDGLDRRNYTLMEQGGVISVVASDAKEYSKMNATLIFRTALAAALEGTHVQLKISA